MWHSKFRIVFSFTLVLLFILPCLATKGQSWLPGYNYRKKITVNKSMVSGTVNLTDFPLLVSLEDPALRYVAGRCAENYLSSSKGLDFAFTLVTASTVPLKYQLDRYDPASGKLISWVKIPSLSASGSTAAATEIYLYYGSNNIHFPLEAEARSTWNTDLNRVWHMNPDATPLGVRNAKSNLDGERLAAKNLNSDSYNQGKIGQAVSLNGVNQYFTSVRDNNYNFFISGWIKLNEINRDQVLITADSAGFGGYVFKINNQNQLVLETRANSVSTEKIATLKLVANQWYHVAAVNQDGKRGFYINGTYYATGFNIGTAKVGGQIFVGCNKQQLLPFNGSIDELQIQTTEPTEDWVKTAYRNQNEPSAFYTVAAQQRNDTNIPTGMVFSGLLSDRWTDAGNWNTREVPGNYEQVIIAKGARLNISGIEELVLNKLDLEPAASVSFNRKLEILCQSTLGLAARLSLIASAVLQFDGQVQNDGLVTAASSNGIVEFSGANVLQQVTGKGTMDLYALHIDQSAKANTVRFEQPVQVNAYIKPITGILDANGFLTLKNTSTGSAFVWPISDLSLTGIKGEVTVEQYVPGNYPEPATARGWRLFAPPVYHGSGASKPYYHLYDYKQSIFVTGRGGSANGFDNSPQNGHTIYTHNQSTIGSLAQKYMGIPTMSTAVFTGKGVYVYSRGDRNTPDAFVKQIQVAPFQNPTGYLISHKGLLYQGDLEVETQNRNMGESGDGFNLLGNPYAASLLWGNLQKEQMSPYVWKYNPLNNAYDVSDDPNTVIAAGEGFFVKVLNGYQTGKVTFKELAKVTTNNISTRGNAAAGNLGVFDLKQQVVSNTGEGSSGAADLKPKLSSSEKVRSLSAQMLNTQNTSMTGQTRIKLNLSRDVFQQQYTLLLSDTGNDELDDQDATALGSGYVGIAGVAPDGVRLSVDSRALPGRRAIDIPIYVRGWASGKYQFSISGLASLPPGVRLMLLDDYLHAKNDISADQTYGFEINNAIPETFGAQRFSLRIENTLLHPSPQLVEDLPEEKIKVYPIPFKEQLNLKLPEQTMMKLGVKIRDLMGQLLLRADLGAVSGMQPATIETTNLASGTYLLEIINLENNQRMKSLKIIKQ